MRIKAGGAKRSASAAITSVGRGNGRDLGKRVRRAQLRLKACARLARMLVDLDPAPGAFGIGAAIGRADFPVMRRLFPDLRDGDAGDEIGDLLVLEASGEAADDQAADFFRAPRRVIERDEAAAGDAEQVELVELEMIGERIEIAGDAAGLRAGCRIGHALAPALAIEGDDAVAGRGEGGNLRLPDFARAGVRMEKNDRHA